jgi:hypothetical protein
MYLTNAYSVNYCNLNKLNPKMKNLRRVINQIILFFLKPIYITHLFIRLLTK